MRINMRFTAAPQTPAPDFEQLGSVLFDRGYRLVGYSELESSFSLRLEIMGSPRRS